MVDPRIYRACLVVVAFAVIVFGFSLQDQPHPLGTTVAPGPFFQNVGSTIRSIAADNPSRPPGSPGDLTLAGFVARYIRDDIGGFTVQTSGFTAQTAAGTRRLETVTATRPGLQSGTIVVVSHRDSGASPGDLSGTAVLLSLARALSGETLGRSVMLVSTSGQIGAVGTTRLARSLAGHDVDAVIVLGDLGGRVIRVPVIVPWSGSDRIAPPLLRNTLAGFLSSQTGIHAGGSSLAGQVARLAFPFAITEQAPFAGYGIPAVLVSLAGDRPMYGNPRGGPAGRAAAVGTAVLQTVNALDNGPAIGAPSGYLVIGGKLVPPWAVRLLVLALMLPVLMATFDAVARALRRGHALARWLGWVLAGSIPFLLGLAALLITRAAGVLSFAPPGAVAGSALPLTGGDLASVLAALAIVIIGFVVVRPACLRLLARVQAGAGARRPESPAADAAAVSLSVVLCGVTLAVWAANPFAALLLVPAMHLWLWFAQPGARRHYWSVALLLALGIAPAGLLGFYYAEVYGLSPLALGWSLALLPGGAMSMFSALYWCVALGCFASAVVVGVRAVHAAATAPVPPMTVRGPASYAGPGSLGGTQSALRR